MTPIQRLAKLGRVKNVRVGDRNHAVVPRPDGSMAVHDPDGNRIGTLTLTRQTWHVRAQGFHLTATATNLHAAVEYLADQAALHQHARKAREAARAAA